jgi:acyl-CoA thioester hydrolase
MKQVFTLPIRVYYEDTDAGCVVYHSQYLNFMERARTEALRSLGFTQSSLRDKMGVLFVVRALEIQYQKPAVFDDELNVVTELIEMRRCLLTFAQVVLRGAEQLTKARVEVVCVNAENFKPTSIPSDIRNSMQRQHP